MRIEQSVKFDEKVYDALINMSMKAKRTRIIRALLSVLGGIYLVLGVIDLIRGYFSPIFMVGGACLIFFGIVYVPIIVRSNVRKANSATRNKIATYICDEDGISVSSSFGDSHYKWVSAQKLLDLDEYVGIRLVNQNTLLLRKEDMTEEQMQWLKGQFPA